MLVIFDYLTVMTFRTGQSIRKRRFSSYRKSEPLEPLILLGFWRDTFHFSENLGFIDSW